MKMMQMKQNDANALCWVNFRKKETETTLKNSSLASNEKNVPERSTASILTTLANVTLSDNNESNNYIKEKCENKIVLSDKKVDLNSDCFKKPNNGKSESDCQVFNSFTSKIATFSVQNEKNFSKTQAYNCSKSESQNYVRTIPLSGVTSIETNKNQKCTQQSQLEHLKTELHAQVKKESPLECLRDVKTQLKRNWIEGKNAIGCGFNNHSNNCYLNSVTQAVFHVPAIANRFDEYLKLNCCSVNVMDPCLMCTISRLWKLSTTTKSEISLRHFFYAMKRSSTSFTMSFTEQEDAHEFYLNLLQSLENSHMARLKTVSDANIRQKLENIVKISDLLAGQLSIEIKCKNCNFSSRRSERFENILLDIPENKAVGSINDAFDKFFEKEHIDDCNYKCDSCNKKVQITKQFFLNEAPKVLCIQLKRFTAYGNKIHQNLKYDYETNLDSFLCSSTTKSTPLCYKLISIVSHHGKSTDHGHYTCTAQVNQNQFYHFNDESINEKDKHTFLSLGKKAYLLFYELDENTMPTDYNKENESPILVHTKETSSDLTASAIVEKLDSSAIKNSTKKNKKSHSNKRRSSKKAK